MDTCFFLKYEGNSHFHVSICDASKCEIDYSDPNLKESRKKETEEDGSVMPPSFPTQKKMRIRAAIAELHN